MRCSTARAAARSSASGRAASAAVCARQVDAALDAADIGLFVDQQLGRFQIHGAAVGTPLIVAHVARADVVRHPVDPGAQRTLAAKARQALPDRQLQFLLQLLAPPGVALVTTHEARQFGPMGGNRLLV